MIDQTENCHNILSIKNIVLNILFALLGLTGIILLFELTNLDIRFQDIFYNRQLDKWFINRKDPFMNAFFYTGPKVIYISAAVYCLVNVILPISKNKKFRDNCLKICLSVALVTGSIAAIKSISNVYTPSQVQRYGGNYPYVKAFESYPADFVAKKTGKGWPAGHASGGFAFMVLFYVFNKPSYRFSGIAAGLAFGWITGLYQTLNGQHFISHSFVTMFMAWIFINLTELYSRILENRKTYISNNI